MKQKISIALIGIMVAVFALGVYLNIHKSPKPVIAPQPHKALAGVQTEQNIISSKQSLPDGTSIEIADNGKSAVDRQAVTVRSAATTTVLYSGSVKSLQTQINSLTSQIKTFQAKRTSLLNLKTEILPTINKLPARNINN